MGNIVEASVVCHMKGSTSHRPPGRCRQRVSLHFECKNCKGWWTVERSSDRTTYYCPWCGLQQSFEVPETEVKSDQLDA